MSKPNNHFYYQILNSQTGGEIRGPFKSIETAVRAAQKFLNKEAARFRDMGEEPVEVLVGHCYSSTPPSKNDLQKFFEHGVHTSTIEHLQWYLINDCHLQEGDEVRYRSERSATQVIKTFLAEFLADQILIARYGIDPLGSTVHLLKPVPPKLPKPSKAMKPHVEALEGLKTRLGDKVSDQTKQAIQKLMTSLINEKGGKGSLP